MTSPVNRDAPALLYQTAFYIDQTLDQRFSTFPNFLSNISFILFLCVSVTLWPMIGRIFDRRDHCCRRGHIHHGGTESLTSLG